MSAEERFYQRNLKRKIEKMLPGCVILKNDPALLQGIPDLLILWQDRWAMLEVKASRTADQQPNQMYYVEKFDGMSFAAFIYPENEKDVLYDLQQSFKSRRSPRIS